MERFEVYCIKEDNEEDFMESFDTLKDAKTYVESDSADTDNYVIYERVLVGKSLIKKTRKWEKA